MNRKSGRKRAANDPERTHLSEAQFNAILRCYAERRSPRDAAEASGLSRNSVYLHYNRIRWRLILTRYYENGALSVDEPGLFACGGESGRMRSIRTPPSLSSGLKSGRRNSS